jgi:hypothetical protein
MGERRDRMVQDMRVRNLSVRTIESYVAAVRGLAKYYGKSPDTLSNDGVHRYLIHVREERQLSGSSCQLIHCGLRFLYAVTLQQPHVCLKVPPARQPQKLPEILNREEVCSILEATRTVRERLLLMLAYWSGLRFTPAHKLLAPGRGIPDRRQQLVRRRLLTFGQFVAHIDDAVIPTPLLSRLRKHGAQRASGAQVPVADHRQAESAQCRLMLKALTHPRNPGNARKWFGVSARRYGS